MSEIVILRDNRKAIENSAKNSLKKALESAGRLVERQAKVNVNKPAGAHPQVQTGRLKSSIKHQLEGDNAVLIGSDISNPPYPTYLELGTAHHPPYPWLFPAVEMQRGALERIFKTSFTISRYLHGVKL